MTYDHLDLQTVLERVEALRTEIDAERPVEADALGRAMQRLRLEWTYHSNAIEGNSLTYGETRALLLHGVTAQGKPLKDHLDIRGHREALDYLERFVRDEEELTLVAIRELNKMLLGDEPYEIKAETQDGQTVRKTVVPGQFKTMPNHVRTATGEPHYYASPKETPASMQDLVDWYREVWPQVEAGEVHAVPVAADLHHRFVAIHPFDDGNGRTARLLMNVVLMRAGYVPAVIRMESRNAYYGVLAQADAGDLQPFVEFVAGELTETMGLYLAALRGEPDPTAFDKRLALLQRRAKSLDIPKRTVQALQAIAKHFIDPYLVHLEKKSNGLTNLFRGARIVIRLLHRTQEGDDVGFASMDLEAKFISRIYGAIGDEDWTNLKVFKFFDSYVMRPEERVSLVMEAQASPYKLVFKRGGEGISLPDIELRYNAQLEPEQARLAADEHLDALMDVIEAVQAKAEDEEGQ